MLAVQHARIARRGWRADCIYLVQQLVDGVDHEGWIDRDASMVAPFAVQDCKPIKHLPALDGLRGFAALMVVVSHSANAGFLPEVLGTGLGQMGVVLFFGLSGFFMAYLYCHRPLNRSSLVDYAISRGTRVLPLYYAVVFVTAMSFILVDLEFLGNSSLEQVAYNALLLKGSSVLWTIPVEVHFYVLFLIIWRASAHGNFTRSIIYLACFQALIASIFLLIGFEFFDLPFWLHVFLFGTLLGGHYDKLRSFVDRSRHKVQFSTLAWIVVLFSVVAPPQLRRDLGIPVLPNYIDPISVGYPLALLTCTVLALGPCIYFRQSILRWYGNISYSLYLLHMFTIVAVAKFVALGFLPNFLAFPAVIGLATLLAAASFYCFERPAQKGLRKWLSRTRSNTSVRAA